MLRFCSLRFRPCSVWQYSFGIFTSLLDKTASAKADCKAVSQSLTNRGCLIETVPLQSLAHYFERGAVPWKLTEESLVWIFQDKAYVLRIG